MGDTQNKCIKKSHYTSLGEKYGSSLSCPSIPGIIIHISISIVTLSPLCFANGKPIYQVKEARSVLNGRISIAKEVWLGQALSQEVHEL